ncbi:hypothetical protein BKA65DRAFT_475271 [Rhexocercosporidium sp. MPI-PUGE-AT-0058]|nr:hypothetical protein BKA65DRAFT_475271 [Rhexocercosporidium sp. MPI-PUGE-AT-0058]
MADQMQRLTLEAIRNFNLSSSDIIECCIHPNRQIIGGQPYGNLVVKLSEELVVKFGAGVSVEEADNQRKTYELLDSGVVRVPRVVRYFTRTVDHTSRPTGYLVMEYIHGDISESLGSHQVSTRL